MAGEAVVGALRIVLGMDTGTLEDDTKKATSVLGGFGKAVAAVTSGNVLADTIEKAAEAFVHLVKGTIETADAMGKASQKFGVPVEELSALKYAADLSDVSFQELGKGLGILSKNMESVAGATKNIAAAAFQSLGISVKDATGNIKPAGDVFLEIADKFKDMQDGATKTALAMAIFGRAGAELIPLLNQGRTGIAGLKDEAKKLGIIITDETAKSAEEFNDNLKRLNTSTQAMILQILGSGGLGKALEDLSVKMIDASSNTDKLKLVGDVAATTLQGVTTWVLATAKALEILITPLSTVVQVFYALYRGDPAKAWQIIKDAVTGVIPNLQELYSIITKGNEDLNFSNEILHAMSISLNALSQIRLKPELFSEEQFKLGEKFNDTIKKINLEAAVLRGEFDKLPPKFVEQAQGFKDLAGFGQIYGKTLDELNPKQRALADALLKLQAGEVTKQINDLTLQTRVLGQEFSAFAPGTIQAAANLGLISKNADGVVNSVNAASPALQQLNAAFAAFNAQKITQDNLTPWETYKQKIDEINASFAGLVDKQGVAVLAAEKAAATMANAYGVAAAGITTPLSTAFKEASELNKGYAGAAKAAAIAEATVNTYVAATKALATIPPPFNYAAAAAVVAAGLVHVAKIQATQFATGGSFKVGGAGGIDSQLVNLALTPGEMVDVRKPGQQATASEITVNLRGRDLFNRDMIRDLFAAINDGTRDGYRLKLAEV